MQGEGMRRLGSVGLVREDGPGNPQGFAHYYPTTLRWAGDDRHVSFVFKNSLFRVPVDG
jgi:hypothetical protein